MLNSMSRAICKIQIAQSPNTIDSFDLRIRIKAVGLNNITNDYIVAKQPRLALSESSERICHLSQSRKSTI